MSQQVETPNLPEEAPGRTFEAGSEDEAVNALSQRTPEAEEAPETPTDEPPEESDEEPDEGEPEDDESAGELAEVEYEGKTYKVPPELQKAVLRQADYSRKMGEVQAKEKDYTQRIETADKLIEGAEKYAKALSSVDSIDAQIKQFEAIDWDALERDDPAKASLIGFKLLRLQQAREQAARGAESVNRELSEARAKTTDAARAEMVKTLAKDLSGWGDELGTKITQYALSKGYSVAEVQAITDPKLVIALDKARKFDAIQDGKAKALGKAKEAPPVSKPGAKRPAFNAANEALARFTKSKSDEDAIAALESRFKR